MQLAGVEALHRMHDAGAEAAGTRRAEAERTKEAQRAEAAREARRNNGSGFSFSLGRGSEEGTHRR